MTVTRQQAFEALARWRPASVFLDSYRSTRLPQGLEIYWGPPEEFFLSPETQARYTQGRLIPLLDDGNFDHVLLDDPDARELVYLAIEDPDEVVRFANWQQYLAHLLMGVGESCDDDEEVRQIAELVEFRYVDELFALWDRVRDLPYDEYEQECRKFVEGIGA